MAGAQPMKISDGSALNRCVASATRPEGKLICARHNANAGQIFVLHPRSTPLQPALTFVNGVRRHSFDPR
jgi:hypothetical protein